MIRLFLVRHGHTIWHDTGGVAGISDIELSVHGEQAMTSLGKTWPLEQHLDNWFCSPLIRTRHSTRLLRHAMNSGTQALSVQEDSRLVELDFGDWEGLTWQQVHSRYAQEMQQWGEDWINRSPPNGETFAAQAARCRAWLGDAIANATGDKALMVVLHGGSIRALVCECLGWPLTRAMDFSVDPASVTVLQTDSPSQGWIVSMINSPDFSVHS